MLPVLQQPIQGSRVCQYCNRQFEKQHQLKYGPHARSKFGSWQTLVCTSKFTLVPTSVHSKTVQLKDFLIKLTSTGTSTHDIVNKQQIWIPFSTVRYYLASILHQPVRDSHERTTVIGICELSTLPFFILIIEMIIIDVMAPVGLLVEEQLIPRFWLIVSEPASSQSWSSFGLQYFADMLPTTLIVAAAWLYLSVKTAHTSDWQCARRVKQL